MRALSIICVTAIAGLTQAQAERSGFVGELIAPPSARVDQLFGKAIAADGDLIAVADTFALTVYDAVTSETVTTAFLSNQSSSLDFNIGSGLDINGTAVLVGGKNRGIESVLMVNALTGAVLKEFRQPPDPFHVPGFEASVALSDEHAFIGMPGANSGRGAVAVFDRESGEQVRLIPAPEGAEGFALSLAVDGDQLIAGAPDTNVRAGAAYLFDAPSGTLTSEFSVSGSGRFGESVAIDGGRAVVGSPLTSTERGPISGQADVIDVETGETIGTFFPEDDRLTPFISQFGSSVAINDDVIAIGQRRYRSDIYEDQGVVYQFDIESTQHTARWTPTHAGAIDPFGFGSYGFGSTVALTESRAFVGAPLLRRYGEGRQQISQGAAFTFRLVPEPATMFTTFLAPIFSALPRRRAT